MPNRSTPDRTTLASLAKQVAIEVAAGQAGVGSLVAGEVVGTWPRAAFDLIEMLLAEGRKARPRDKLVAAYVHMIGQALEAARQNLENGQAVAGELVDAIRQTVLDAGASGRVSPERFMTLLTAFTSAKLDLGTELRRFVATQVEQLGSGPGAGKGGGDFDTHVGRLARDLGGDPFALCDQLLEMAGALPDEHRAGMGLALLATREPSAREAVVGWLLDPSAEVRRTVASALEQSAAHGLVSGSMFRRLIALRNWLPEADRPWLDRAIQACRRAGVECAPWPASQVQDTLSTGIDGAGAQSVFLVAREGRRKAMGFLLIKSEVGVREGWARHRLTRAEVEGTIEAGAEVYPVDPEYVRTATAHALSVNQSSGILPPFGLLDIAEVAGLSGLQPEALPLQRLLDRLEAEAGPDIGRSEAELLAQSRALVNRFDFLLSWFDVGEDVGQLLGAERIARPRRVALVLEELLPRHATRWADKLARTALLLRHRDEEEPWQAFFVSAKAVLAGRPLSEIPLMRHVATRTADAYEQNRRAM